MGTNQGTKAQSFLLSSCKSPESEELILDVRSIYAHFQYTTYLPMGVSVLKTSSNIEMVFIFDNPMGIKFLAYSQFCRLKCYSGYQIKRYKPYILRQCFNARPCVKV